MAPAEHHRTELTNHRMVDLFAGPGGLDVAARWLGIDARGVEWDANACTTRRAAGLNTEEGDVRDFGPKDFPKSTILAGGPPCQTYTMAGNGSGRRALDEVLSYVGKMAAQIDVSAQVAELEDERTGLVLQPLRWALEANISGMPYEAIVLEQVPAVLPVWEAIASVLRGIGYSVDCGILRTEEYGVPQTRRRAILIASRHHEVALPSPTHRRYFKGVARSAGDSRYSEWETMSGALGRKEPFVVISNYGSGGDPKARGRRRSDEPSATVTGKISRNRVVTPENIELQRFSNAEAGRLQTFPVDYPWSGKDIAQQIGNAIPPRLAAHVLASALKLEIDDGFFDAVVRSRWDDYRSKAMLETVPVG